MEPSTGYGIILIMVLNIHVNYKPPSKERLFLGAGWGGVRDVRGPYLSGLHAEVVIENWILSEKIPSTVYLALEVTNACTVDALFVNATNEIGVSQVLIKRNGQNILTISGILANRSKHNAVITLEPTFGGKKGVVEEDIDIVAINELQLIR